MTRTPQQQLVHFLSDMYSVEQQALAQLVSAPDLAGDPQVAADCRLHHTETEQQADRVRQRLEAHGGEPSKIKDAVMKLGGKGFLLFAQVQPETPGRLVVHAYAYEAMEMAGYEMLFRFAEAAGDGETAILAKAIGDEERTMMNRLERGFDAAEAVSHADVAQEKLPRHVSKHLAEVHAFESQCDQLLQKSEQIAGTEPSRSAYSRLLEQVRRQAHQIEQRLAALDTSSSTLKDTALALGGWNWALFFQAQSDTPAKLAAFVYAVLHLQIGAYELLKRTARRAADTETERLCETILAEKRAMAEELRSMFDAAVQATLQEVERASA